MSKIPPATPNDTLGRRVVMITREPSKGGSATNIVVHEPRRPGAVPIGMGKTMEAALGRWLINNQSSLGLFIDVHESAHADELARREKELSKR